MNCKDCKYWGKTVNCTSCDSSHMRFCYMMMNNLQPDFLRVGADDDYNLQCMTHENFGCILFKPKD